MKWTLVFVSLLLVSLNVFAQLTPHSVTPDTIALWNFDSDEGDVVKDSANNPLNGTAYSALSESIPNLDPSFELGRKFSSANSFIDLGVAQGSKLDFTGQSEFSVGAIIHLTSSASSTHIIYSSDNVRLAVVNNQLAGMIRQPGGLYGLVSSTNLLQNTSYRVGLHYLNQQVVLTINGRINAKVVLDYPLSAPEFSTSRAYIGGDIFGKFFPGYVDDIYVSNTVGIDTIDPTVELIEPASFQVTVLRPQFLWNISDSDSGIDTSSIKVYLNGVQQTSLQISNGQISGTLNDDFKSGILNEVILSLSDIQGNAVEKKYYFSYQNILGKGEYQTDPFTLALWHFNDFSNSLTVDSSGNNHHGYSDQLAITTGEGVFSKGKYFSVDKNSLINFDGIRFNDKFTVEGWFYPTASSSSLEYLFYNGQIAITRTNGGYVRVLFYTTTSTLTYTSPDLLLPEGALHHLAVSWDKNLNSNNLRIYIDGIVKHEMTAAPQCDFDPIPRIGQIGSSFTGMIDEMRISKTIRTGFNIPTTDGQAINFLTLTNGTSTNNDFPELHVRMNSSGAIDVNTVKVSLNNVVEPASANLIITSTSIDGTFSHALSEGLNIVDVEFVDSAGNLKKKSQYFFKITKAGLSEYESDEFTAGLWHFQDSGNPLIDSSGNGNHFSGTPFPVNGVLGLGQDKPVEIPDTLALNCRSFTFEGYFKSMSTEPNEFLLYNLRGTSLSQYLYVTPSNGNLHLNMASSSQTLDTVLPAALPVDSGFHHLALIYDGARDFSQLMVLVDGEVKGAFDFKNSCDVQGGNYLALDTHDRFHFDEVRVSKKARYSLNIMADGGDRPDITSMSIEPESTVSSATLPFSIHVEDGEGVNVGRSKIFVNGISFDLSQNLRKSTKISVELTSNLNLLPGANEILIKIYDFEGNETIKALNIYYFSKAAPGEYSPDAQTAFLYHFNEESGNFQDSSGNSSELSSSGWVIDASGPFGQGASNFTPFGSITHPDLSSVSGYTAEFWFNFKSPGYGADVMYRPSFSWMRFDSLKKFFIHSDIDGSLILVTQIPESVSMYEYHHYAVVVDKGNPRKNIYVLLDGKVLQAAKLPVAMLNLSSSTTLYPGARLYNNAIDEMRFSSVPRYELISTKE